MDRHSKHKKTYFVVVAPLGTISSQIFSAHDILNYMTCMRIYSVYVIPVKPIAVFSTYWILSMTIIRKSIAIDIEE